MTAYLPKIFTTYNKREATPVTHEARKVLSHKAFRASFTLVALWYRHVGYLFRWFWKVFVLVVLLPCITAWPPMRERIWTASFAPPTDEKSGDFPLVFIQFWVPPAGHKKTPQVFVTYGVAPADGRSVFSCMVKGSRPRLTGSVPLSRHFVVFQRVKAHSTVVKS